VKDGRASLIKGVGSLAVSSPQQSLNCYVCRREIKSSDPVQRKGEWFHSEHFKCGDCKKELDEQNFTMKDNRVLCPDCNFKRHGVFCGRCEKQIKTSFIHILDKGWHDECFDCHVCHAKFDDSLTGIHNIDGNPYCESCYDSTHAGACSVCDKSIGLGELVEAQGERFHKSCFVCAEGPHEMESGSFWKHDGKLYCVAHWESLNILDKCFRCKKSIDSEYVKIGTKIFHPKCWTCNACRKIIRDNEAGQVAGEFYCAECCKSGRAKAGKGKGKMTSAGIWVPEDEEEAKAAAKAKILMVKPKRLVRGYGEYEAAPGTVPPWESKTYPLEIVRLRPPKIPKEIDFRQREQYLEDKVFKEVFGVDMVTFNGYPLWKRLMMKKERDLF